MGDDDIGGGGAEAAVRGRGIGTALIRHLARLAVEHGCSRLDWIAEMTNPGALALRDRLGASRRTDKVYCRLDGAGSAAMAERG